LLEAETDRIEEQRRIDCASSAFDEKTMALVVGWIEIEKRGVV